MRPAASAFICATSPEEEHRMAVRAIFEKIEKEDQERR